MNTTGNTSGSSFCIRKFVADVRRRDWRSCCPFNLCIDSEKSERQEKKVYASLFLEKDDVFIDTKEKREAPNSAEVGNPETLTDIIVCNVPCQNENSIPRGAMADENDDGANRINDGPSETAPIDVEEAQGQKEERISEDAKPARTHKQQRNSRGRKPPKFRLLLDIYKELGFSVDSLCPGNNTEGEFSSGSDKDSDFTLDTCIIEKKVVRASSRSSGAHKGKRRISKSVEPKFVRAKRTKHDSQEDSTKKTEHGSKWHLRSRTVPASSSVTSEDNTSGTCEFQNSLLAHKAKRNGHTAKEDCAREVSNNMETASGVVHNKIRETFPFSDVYFMAAKQLIKIWNKGVPTNTSVKTATKDPAISKELGKGSCELDGQVPPPAASGLTEAEQAKSGISVCLINRNPSDFKVEEAKKFMRCGYIIGEGGN